MVQYFDAVESVIFAEYLKTDRARGDECADTVFAEQFGIVIHHSAGRLNFPGKFQRTAAADAAVLGRPTIPGSPEALKICSIERSIFGERSVMHPAK